MAASALLSAGTSEDCTRNRGLSCLSCGVFLSGVCSLLASLPPACSENATQHVGCEAGWCDVTAECTTGREAHEGYSGWDYCLVADREAESIPATNFTPPPSAKPSSSLVDEEQDWRVQITVLLILAGYVWHLKNQTTAETESAVALPPPTMIPHDAKLSGAMATDSEIPLDTPRPTAADVSAANTVRAHGLNPAALQSLEAIYATYCPAKLSQAPELLSKYSGREDQLLRLVQAKYCPTSADFDPTLPTPR